MPLLILLSMLLTTAFGAEVATLESPRSNSTELLLVMTDETLQTAVEKAYLAHSCRYRSSINSSLKEYYFPGTCRAEITKFLLNNGYKPDNLYRTFQK
jgi:hypothetical protein